MYELFDHTADLGLRIEAADLDTLFAEAGQCLFAAILDDPFVVRPLVGVAIELEAENREFLLFDWLRELLMRFEGERLVFGAFEVHVRDGGLSAVARGEPFDPARHALAREVKAITYHALKVVDTGTGWLAEVIVDI